MTATKQDLKLLAIKKLGGGCVLCEYNKCASALHFHHINPCEKDYNVSKKSTWYDIQKEIKKCALLCANCHAELHAGLVDIETVVWLQEERRL